MPAVLIVDDEVQILRALQINLNARGYSTVTAFTGQGPWTRQPGHSVDVVILDLGLPDLDGVEVLRRLRRLERASPSSSSPPGTARMTRSRRWTPARTTT